MIYATKELVESSGFNAETVKTEAGTFGRSILASDSSVPCFTAVGLLYVT